MLNEGDLVRVSCENEQEMRVGMVTQTYSSPWWEITFPDGKVELIFRGHLIEMQAIEALHEGVKHGITTIGR